jgi:signal transduction histidine kinase
MSGLERDLQRVAKLSAVPTILRVITESLGLRLSLIAKVTDEQWTCCAVHDELGFGLQVGDHLDVATTLCSEVRSSRAPIVISHASEDAAYCGHPTPKLYNFESYIAVPIILPSGAYFGNVCALDSQPAKLDDPRTLATMQLFAQLVAAQLEAENHSELREQFIAILAHDLRSPLQAIVGSAELLSFNEDPAHKRLARMILSSSGRINHLVSDLLDYARGQLGDGVPLAAERIDDVTPIIQQAIDEARAAHPERTTEVLIDGVRPIVADAVRLGQLLSNLIGNALEHGDPKTPVRVTTRITPRDLEIAVHNQGDVIPEQDLATLFQPYRKGSVSDPSKGLGLGLYIVAQIARSHGGHVDVSSTEADGTTFTCSLPRAA